MRDLFRPLDPSMFKIKPTLGAFPFDVPTLMDTLRQNWQTLASAQQLTLEGWQMIMHRQGALANILSAGQADWLRTLIQRDRPQDKIGDQALLLKQLYERLQTHQNELHDMMHQSSRETSSMIQKRVTRSLAEIKDAVDRANTKRAA